LEFPDQLCDYSLLITRQWANKIQSKIHVAVLISMNSMTSGSTTHSVGDSAAIIFTAQGSSPQLSPVRMAVLSQNTGIPYHAGSSQFYDALNNYDVHNVLRQQCTMQCDRIDKVIYSLKTQHINITNLATCLG
jgi:hypothetical protein